MKDTIVDTYARSLAELEGDAFESEVCARFTSVILGFQMVPATPHGDGGLDGLSHDGQHGYCCYGPQHNAVKTNKERVDDIVEKFTADLRHLFELETQGKKLVHKENTELSTILPKGQKLVYIKLVVNWFESHRIIGRIGTAVAACKKASQCRYVDVNVQVAIVGPKELARLYPVDEITIARVRHWKFVEKIQQNAQSLAIDNPKDFDLKMSVLSEILPDHSAAIATLADNFRSDWRTALALERELGDTAPTLHHALERGRQQIATRVTTLMLGSNQPWTQLDRATEIAKETLEKDFGTLYGSLVTTVATGEVARLIGECPIGWKKGASPIGG